MDNVKEILDKLRTYPNTYKELFVYFKNILKKDKIEEQMFLNLKVSAFTPHLIKFIEMKGLVFLDVLIYTNYHIFSPDYNFLMIKAIYVGFSKLENNKPLNFDIF